MRVLIQREGCRGVAKILLYGFHIVARAKRRHGVGVPQIVKALLRKAGVAQDPPERFQHRFIAQEFAKVACEDEIGKTVIVPQRTGEQPRPVLLEPVLLQYLHDVRRRRKNPRLIVFRRAEVIRSALYPGALELFIDEDRSVPEINAAPLQAEDLRFPHTGEDIDAVKGLEAMAPDRLKEGFDLGTVQRGYLRLLDTGQRAGFRWVGPDIAQLYSLFERGVQNPVHVFDRLGGHTRPQQLIIELLYLIRVQRGEVHGAERGPDVILDMLGIGNHRGWFHIYEVGILPVVKPHAHGHLRMFDITAVIQRA